MAADGLRPVTVHEVVLRDGEKRLPVLAALITDRHSSIPPTVLLPYLGLTSEGEGDAYRGRSHVEGEKALGGRSFVVSVRLTDGSGNIRAIRTGAFSSIPYPYERGVTQLIKSAMKTVRIPLASYTVANAGAQIVDLTNVQSIAFGFLSRPTGEVEVDDTELVP